MLYAKKKNYIKEQEFSLEIQGGSPIKRACDPIYGTKVGTKMVKRRMIKPLQFNTNLP